MARRLFIAFLIAAALALVGLLVLPRLGAPALPLWVPVLAFLAMVGGAVAVDIDRRRAQAEERARAEADALDDQPGCGDDGCPISCAGPRPVGEITRRAERRG